MLMKSFKLPTTDSPSYNWYKHLDQIIVKYEKASLKKKNYTNMDKFIANHAYELANSLLGKLFRFN